MWWSLILNVAMAGKLAEGYRSIPYGHEPVLETPPSEGCSYLPEPATKWSCSQTIGDASVITSYAVDQGIYYGVVIHTATYRDSMLLMGVLQAAYGPGSKLKDFQTGELADRIWRDGPVFASFTFNEYSNTGALVIIHRTLMEEMKLKKAAQASKSTGDL